MTLATQFLLHKVKSIPPTNMHQGNTVFWGPMICFEVSWSGHIIIVAWSATALKRKVCLATSALSFLMHPQSVQTEEQNSASITPDIVSWSAACCGEPGAYKVHNHLFQLQHICISLPTPTSSERDVSVVFWSDASVYGGGRHSVLDCFGVIPHDPLW